MSDSKWPKIIFIIIGILVVLIILIGVVVGVSGLRSFFKWLIGLSLFLGILFGLMYVFYIIFLKPQYRDIPATYRKKLHRTARLMKNEMLGDLYLSGDEKHNRIKLGKYRYLRLNLPRQIRVEKPNKDPHSLNRTIVEEHTEAVKIDCFMVLRKGIVNRLFGDPIFILTKSEDHGNSAVFGDLVLNGFNLVPIDNEFFTLDHRNLDIDIIKGVATNYIREVVYEIFKDLDKLVKQAMNLDQRFQKEKQKNLEFEIPQIEALKQLGKQ